MRRILCFLLLAANISAAKPAEWHMINVNNEPQGDAHLLIDGEIVTLIDAGDLEQATRYLLPYLRSKGISTIHHMFVTHPHDDHFAGLVPLIENGIDVEQLYYNQLPQHINYLDKQSFEQVMTFVRAAGTVVTNIRKGFSVSLPDSRLKVLHAQKETSIDGEPVTINDFSLVVQWDAGEFRSLFTGDLGSLLGQKLAKHRHFKADILKVPHHGVSDIAPTEFFDTVNPDLNMFPSTVALWTHPRIEQSKTWTLAADILYCHNGLNGTVVLLFEEDAVFAESDNPTQSCPNGRLSMVPGEQFEIPSLTPLYQLLLGEKK